jgi:hypothetical protein
MGIHAYQMLVQICQTAYVMYSSSFGSLLLLDWAAAAFLVFSRESSLRGLGHHPNG